MKPKKHKSRYRYFFTVTTQAPATLSSSRLRCPLCELSFDTDDLLISHDNEVHAAKGELKFQVPI